MKTCTKCNIEKPLEEFNKRKQSKDGYNSHCRLCANNYTRKSYTEYNKNYSLLNKEKKKEYNKKWVEENRDKNRLRKNNYVKNRIKIDAVYKCKINTRKLLSTSFKRNGFSKSSKTQEILGCSFDEFKNHIESLWLPWMNWDNYGLYDGSLDYGWDIDHIIPSSSAKSEDDIIRLNHYTNLQPLCSFINRNVKRDNY